MTRLTPRVFGERVWYRLSDLPETVRTKGAEKAADIEIKNETPLQALANAAKIRFVANDPKEAARIMPTECENGVHSVPLDVWMKVVKVRPGDLATTVRDALADRGFSDALLDR